MADSTRESVPHVVIVGGGFGGLNAAKALKKAPVHITLIDRANHHLFQPLLYQVATAGLSAPEIASPIRSILRKQKNLTVLLAEVTGVNLEKKTLRLAKTELPYVDVPYDYLILAVGAQTSYFGNDQWAPLAVGLKDLDDALEIRRRVLLAFEAAEREPDTERRRRLLTLVVIGGGPTGVEMAGALAELTRFVLARDFRNINPRLARVTLIEAGDRLLSAFAEDLSERARLSLERLGVQVSLNSSVTDITPQGVRIGEEFIPSATVLWTAGVSATPLNKTLGVELDRAGRVRIEPDLSIPNHPDAFAIGDMALLLGTDGKPLPGLAPVAMQQAKFAADAIAKSMRGEARGTFEYKDRGSMATIGRKSAVAQVFGLRLSGFLAWLAWLLVHIIMLIGFRNRLFVLINWFYNYFTYLRGARIITGRRIRPGVPDLPAQLSRESSRMTPLTSERAPRTVDDAPSVPAAKSHS